MSRTFGGTRLLAGCAVGIIVGMSAACYPLRRAEPLVGPMTLEDPGLLRGRLLFDRHCYKCHLEGEGGLAPAINNKPLPKFLMRLQVRAGLGTMPSFSEDRITDDELDDILDYLVTLRHHDGSQAATAGG